MQFEDVIGAYLSAKPRLTKASRETYSLKNLLPFFGGFDVKELKRAKVRAYIANRLGHGVKLSTVRRELRLFSAAINFVRDEYEINLPNPVARLGLPSEEPRVRWITREEARRLLEASRSPQRPHLEVFIRLALSTGCRKSELLKLEWERVDLNRRCFLLEARHTKAKKRRTVPLNDSALGAFRKMRCWQDDYAPQTPFVFGWERGRIASLKTSWTNALRRAGIENFRIHDLRHTFASWLVMQGVSLYVVKELLGHSSITQTEIYAHLAPDAHCEAVQKILLF